MKKVRGFTMTEILLVLALSSIVMGIGYLGIELIMKQYFTSKKLAEKSIHFHEAVSRFKKDFFNAQRSIVDGNELKLIQDQRSITYLFTDEFIIRRDDQVQAEDTLSDKLIKHELFQNSSPQFIRGSEIDSVVLQLDYFGEDKKVIVNRKMYAKSKLESLGN